MERDICFEIRALTNLIRRDIEKSKESESLLGVHGVHGWAIGYFYRNRGKDIFQRDFENEFSMRRSTASTLLSGLEQNGLIIRQSVDYDARLKKIVLTDKAIEIHKKIISDIKSREKKMRKGLTEEELDMFFLIMKKFRVNLEEKDD